MPRLQPSGDALGFAVRKDIRNNLVREVDRAKHRRMWETAFVLVMLVAIVLVSAWQHFEIRNYGYLMEQLQKDQAAEDAAGRHLRLEIETLQSPSRIEDLAGRKLKMVAPSSDDAIVIERVTGQPAPPKSAVASASDGEGPR